MVRNYVRRSTRQSWCETSMSNAVKAVVEKEMGYKKAATIFNVPGSTLRDRVKKVKEGSKDITNSGDKGFGNFKTVFTKDQEKEIADHILLLESRLFPVTIQDLRRLAFQLAESNNLQHDFDKDLGMAGYKWVENFLKRNPNVSLRKPEGTSGARAMGFNKIVVDKFFDLLTDTMAKYRFPSDRIFNVDETGISTVPKKVSKVLAKKGKAQVGALTSGERGKTITVEICMSASGEFIPPMFIFPRVRAPQNINLQEKAPPGSIVQYHPSGWMQTELFLVWFDHFLSYVKPTKESPVLLLLDGHATHTKNLGFINKARDNNVVVICFPPHSSHRIQPLDVAFMAPLSQYYSTEVKHWLRMNYPRMVTEYQVPELFGTAYMKAAVMLTAVNGYRKTGIFPLNRNVFEEWMFEPAASTNRPLTPLPRVTDSASAELITTEKNSGNEATSQPHSSTENFNAGDCIVVQADVHTQKTPTPLDNNSPTATAPRPSTSSNFSVTPPKDLIKLPNNHRSKPIRSKRKGRATVLTSSPYKKECELIIAEKEKKKRKKNVTTKNKTAKRRKTEKEPLDSEDEEPADCVCIYCHETYSTSKSTDGWIKCTKCPGWAHEACAGIDADDDVPYVCDYCT